LIFELQIYFIKTLFSFHTAEVFLLLIFWLLIVTAKIVTFAKSFY